ncbi:hypothetical protein [Arenibaculum pallidiluteum]|uniref:hypothetical protein n=1 Tax=Arenibaculum pallidiluteum TaxID=2812559 RepID=UPI001A975F70|nr:hypothetical protein [Arenibaculum pallidiluteum]
MTDDSEKPRRRPRRARAERADPGAGAPPGTALNAPAGASADTRADAPTDALTDAHAVLKAVYADPGQDWPLRVSAAKAAIRYERPALASTELTGKDGGPVLQRIEVAFVEPGGEG